MFANLRIPLLRSAFTLLLALALVALPLGHRTTAAAQLDPALMAFVQAGGTLADLCNGMEGAGHAALDCEACSSMAGAGLPPPLLLLITRRETGTVHPVSLPRTHLPRGPAGFPPPQRAPPLV